MLLCLGFHICTTEMARTYTSQGRCQEQARRGDEDAGRAARGPPQQRVPSSLTSGHLRPRGPRTPQESPLLRAADTLLLKVGSQPLLGGHSLHSFAILRPFQTRPLPPCPHQKCCPSFPGIRWGPTGATAFPGRGPRRLCSHVPRPPLSRLALCHLRGAGLSL